MHVQVFVNKFENDWSISRKLGKAVDFVLELDHEADHYKVLEYVFEQLNVGGDLVPAEEWTVRYREAGNPSLSVDDIVVLNDKAWKVARIGWEPIEVPEEVSA